MAKRASGHPRTELELRVELAERRAERDQKHARSLCAVDSDRCRAGDEWEWFDLSDKRTHRTYCFCPGHALAAELCCVGDEHNYASMGVEQFLTAVRRAEQRATEEQERASV